MRDKSLISVSLLLSCSIVVELFHYVKASQQFTVNFQFAHHSSGKLKWKRQYHF